MLVHWLLAASIVSAHNIGVYAGTHIIEMEATPYSPFIGELVNFKFRIKDLRGQFPKEPIIVAVEIKDDRTESVLFNTSPTQINDGRFEMSFAFPREGLFDVQLNFWPPENPSLMKDGSFAMQVRKAPRPSYQLLAGMGLAGFVLGLLTGLLLPKHKTVSNP